MENEKKIGIFFFIIFQWLEQNNNNNNNEKKLCRTAFWATAQIIKKKKFVLQENVLYRDLCAEGWLV